MRQVLARLLRRATAGAGAATLLAVGVAVGVVLAVAALGGAPDVVTVVGATSSSSASGNPSPHGRALGHDKAGQKKSDKADESTADESEKAEKAETSEKGETSDGGVHGSCVAAVAQDASATAGPRGNHGGAVSRAAHTCPHPTPSGSATR